MDLIQRLQELPPQHYAVAGVCLVLLVLFLLKLGFGLVKKIIFLGLFVVLALVILVTLQG
ncbi:hypothetical protein [Luteolibacter luteus]|uniref:Uncharacterized protein n=1 Tax=Luteolibacter luteus TaxID=2728835 RepID=A0A858RR36_9BACT|nr:hypothetical protein [Luteolibacter luteus]QJE98393.1 hypothetical protein HHL09_22260 [Luteolibacter luteus]